MYTLNPNTHFLKKARKLVRRNKKVQQSLEKTLSLLQENPFSRSLQTHKALAEYDGKNSYTSFVTQDLRVIWRFNEGVFDLLDLIDIGGHSGSKKVYR